MNQHSNLTDEKLFEMCRKFGSEALLARRQFLGLLPEVWRRRLYEKKGFVSIFEFAAKLAGVSAEQVKRVLSLEESFQDKPALHELLVSGEASVNKLARVASIATVENQQVLAEQVRLLPKSAVETLVRDERLAINLMDEQRVEREVKSSGQIQLDWEEAFVPGHKVRLSDEVQKKLLELEKKGIDVNKLILEMLEKRECEIERKKEQLAEEIMLKTVGVKSVQTGRYIPVKIRKFLSKEHGEKCSIQNCRKSAKVIHHTQRFALSRNHDPHFLAPLCKDHQIAHSIDLKVQARTW